MLFSHEKEVHFFSFIKTWINLEGTVLSERNSKRQIVYGITYKWNLKSQTHWNRVVARGMGSGRNEDSLVKEYIISVIRFINSGDIMYNMVTIANNAVLYVLIKLIVMNNFSHLKSKLRGEHNPFIPGQFLGLLINKASIFVFHDPLSLYCQSLPLFSNISQADE